MISIKRSFHSRIDLFFLDSPDYESGTNVTITAEPAEGWKFVRWQGSASGTTNPLLVMVTGEMNVVAVFEEDAPESTSYSTSVRHNYVSSSKSYIQFYPGSGVAKATVLLSNEILSAMISTPRTFYIYVGCRYNPCNLDIGKDVLVDPDNILESKLALWRDGAASIYTYISIDSDLSKLANAIRAGQEIKFTFQECIKEGFNNGQWTTVEITLKKE